MFRVTSLAEMPDAQLNRWIKRLGIVLLLGIVGFVAFYAVDRFRAPTAPIVDQQLTALEQAVRDDPSDIASRGQLADVYMAAERYDDAIAQYTEIIATGKADKEGYASRARAYLLSGQLDAAKSDYEKTVQLLGSGEMANVDPALEAAYYGLGSIALQQDQAQDAIDNLLKALTINRADADAMNLIGAAYVKAGQPDKAIEALNRAVAFVPVGWADPYRTLADAYTATGQAELAAWATAMGDLADGDSTTAESELRAISSADTAVQVQVDLGLGLVFETRGDLASAADAYGKAIALDPSNASASLGLSRTRAPQAPTAAPSEGSNS